MSIMDVFADLFMGILASSFCILIIYFFRKIFFDMGVLTFKGLTFIYGLIILRALVPLELPFAVPVRCQLLVPVTDFLFFNPIQYKGTEYYGWQIVVSLYLTLVLLFIFRLVFYYVKADRTLKHIPCITDMNTCALLGKVISEAKQTVNVRLLTSSDIYSPISSGIFEPAIVLPANYHKIYSESELYFILKHEYTHVIKHDSTKKLLLNIASCFLFWNPCMILLKKNYIQFVELQCDNRTISELSSDKKIAYLGTMLSVLKNKKDISKENNTAYKPALSFVSNEAIFIKERFSAVKNYSDELFQKKNALVPIIIAAIILYSYTFIFQAQYDPPVLNPDTYYLDGGVNMDQDYLAVYPDGTCRVFFHNGLVNVVPSDYIDLFKEYNGKIVYEP